MSVTTLGVNVIAYRKDNQNYAMTCAWSTMSDFKEIVAFIGTQSETGKNLEVGMKLGYSTLKEGQEKIANIIGSSHSSENDKLANIEYEEEDGAIIIKNCYKASLCQLKAINTDVCGTPMYIFEVLKEKDFNGRPLLYNDMEEEKLL